MSQTHTPAWNKHPLLCWTLGAVVGGCFSSLHLIFYTDSTCYFDEGQSFREPTSAWRAHRWKTDSPSEGVQPWVCWFGGMLRQEESPLLGSSCLQWWERAHSSLAPPHLSPEEGLAAHPGRPAAPRSRQYCLSPPCSLIRLSLLPPSLLSFKNGPWQNPLWRSLWGIKWDKNCLLLQNIAEFFLLH